MNVAGRLVLVTGASSGIGAALARQLGARGARVILVSRTKAKLDAVAADVEAAGGQAHVVPCDLGDLEAVQQSMAHITAELGVPDVIVNNAGRGRWLFTEETEPAEVQRMMSVPYFAAFWTTQAFLGAMLERDDGLIVTVNSPAWVLAWPGATGYAAARSALHAFTEGLRADVHGTNVRVSHVTLGEVESGYWAANPGARERVPTIAGMLLGEAMSSEEAGRIVLERGIEREKGRVMAPFMLGVLHQLNRLMPWVVERLTWATAATRE